nr:unnamed protein product [Callosobruchus chinensis]CAH7769574.1 unnamed protein product [Callosobruchus chinensis]
MLHFSENNQADKNDRQAKIRPLLFVLENNFQTIYTLGPNIVIDNFYTSITLAQTLLNRNTHLVGTLRKNRKNLPKSVSTKTLALGTTLEKKVKRE